MAGRIDRDLDRAIAQGSAVYAQQLAEELTGAEKRFSPRFEAAMEGMIARQSAAKAAGGVKRQLRAAAVVLVCFGVLGVGAMRVEAIRLPLLELLVGEQESYTEVAFPSLEDNSTFRGEIQDYLPTYLPEGYQLESVEEDERFIHAAYGCAGRERLLLTATPAGGSSVMLDRQGVTVTQAEIGTRGAFIAEREEDERLVVLMFDNSYAYTLTAYLGREEAVAIMASIPGAG